MERKQRVLELQAMGCRRLRRPSYTRCACCLGQTAPCRSRERATDLRNGRESDVGVQQWRQAALFL